MISEYTSESELDDHASVLRRFAPRVGVPEYFLQSALVTVGARIGGVQIAQAKASDADVPNTEPVADDGLGDNALYSLFDTPR